MKTIQRTAWASLALGFVLGLALLGCGEATAPPAVGCVADADCDDGNVCTADVCSAGACSHVERLGESCSGGFCDVDAVCVEQCPTEPCQMAHVEPGVGCVYEQRPNGWTCSADDYNGTCANGTCIPPKTCSADAECVETDASPCETAVCVLGACAARHVPFGVQCRGSTDPTQICDGLGTCGDFMPYGSEQCYTPKPLAWSECPTCDDADPTTADACEMIGGLEQCVHAPLPEGHMCGPWYTIQGGQCCPHPDTLP